MANFLNIYNLQVDTLKDISGNSVAQLSSATIKMIGAGVLGNTTTDQQLLLNGGNTGNEGDAGATLLLIGNTNAGSPGSLRLRTGTSIANAFISLRLGDSTANIFLQNSSGQAMWTFNGSGQQVQGAGGSDIVFSKTVGLIRHNTTDGADSNVLTLASGGAASNTRGAYISMSGNEFPSVGGTMNIVAGDTSTAKISLQAANSASFVEFLMGGLQKLKFDNAGLLALKSHSAYATSGKFTQTAAAQTTNATTTNLYTLTLADNTSYTFDVEIVGRLASATNKGVGGKLRFTVFRNNAGAATIAADFGGRIKEIESYGSSGYDFDVDVSSNDVRIRITGAAAETVNWIGGINYVAVSTNT